MTKDPIEVRKANEWQPVDDRRVGFLRLLLSLSALFIVFIDPVEPDRYVEETYLLLFIYCAYSFVIFLLGRFRQPQFNLGYLHWIDVIWFSGLISLSSGTSSIFFLFYLFAILIAAFRWGFASGFKVTVVSIILFIIIGLTGNESPGFELNRLLLRPIYLLILGYLISYWGGRELMLRHRLDLLSELSQLSNPRAGAINVTGSILERVRKFYEAESCLLLLDKDSEFSFNWLKVDGSKVDHGFEPENTSAGLPLLEIPESFSISFNGKSDSIFHRNTISSGDKAADLSKAERNEKCEVLSDILAAGRFLTVPLKRRSRQIGRIYVVSAKKAFRPSDSDFLEQIAAQVFPSIENIRLLDSMASGAIERQRKKISFDIHDSTIQPYIGLKLGLEALEMKADPEGELTAEIQNLVRMADLTISDLRHFVKDLKTNGHVSGDVLASALEQQAKKFKDYYDISVQLNIDCDLSNNDRLVAEIFQMVAEGLSNIRRHTNSKDVRIGVFCEHENVILSIENGVLNKAVEFSPKSLTERTEYLGGSIEVLRDTDLTRITIAVPQNVEIK